MTMDKVSAGVSNNFCPQALYLYGTYKEDGTPNFALFSWFGFCWDQTLHAMVCIGGDKRKKLTTERIHATGVFSANLVSEPLLPLADYLGNTSGYSPDKMAVPRKGFLAESPYGARFSKSASPSVEIIPGEVLPVPMLKASPWSFELEVKRTIPLEGSEIFLCEVRNALADGVLLDQTVSIEERMARVAPVLSAGRGLGKYFAGDLRVIGAWGDWRR